MRAFFLVLACLFAAFAAGKEKGKLTAQGGIKTPGIQIPFASLKTEAAISLEANPKSLIFSQQLLASTPAKIQRIDVKTNKPLEAWTGSEGLCGGLVQAFGHVWVPACGKNAILKLEAKTGKLVNTLEIGAQAAETSIAASSDSLWALTDAKGTLARIDPQENHVVAEIRLPSGCSQLSFEADSLWASCPQENRVLRLDPKTNVVTHRIEAGSEPTAMAFAEGILYVLSRKDGKIAKLDTKTNKVTGSIETLVPGAAGSMTFGDGYLWISQEGFPLSKIDLKTDKVVQQFWGEGAGTIKFAAGALWLAPAGKPQILRLDPKRIAVTLAE